MAARRVHLDTDFGGDPDDVCALALLLATPGVEVSGITTNLDHGGERAGCVQYALELAGAGDIPVRAGAGVTLTEGQRFESTAGDPRYWPVPITPRPGPLDDALDLVAEAIARDETIITIGALTNLAHLEQRQRGALRHARVVVMGGWIRPLASGLPQWGPQRDFNIQCDARAADIALRAIGDLTLATLPALAVAHLRSEHIGQLRAAGALGSLLARQADVYALDTNRAALATEHEALPDDLLNFHWDPVTCAIATGWKGATVEELALDWNIDAAGVLRMRENEGSSRAAHVVTAVDGDAFARYWLERVTSLHR